MSLLCVNCDTEVDVETVAGLRAPIFRIECSNCGVYVVLHDGHKLYAEWSALYANRHKERAKRKEERAKMKKEIEEWWLMVMPMIGPLLDAWDELPNDIVTDPGMEKFRKIIERIIGIIEEE